MPTFEYSSVVHLLARDSPLKREALSNRRKASKEKKAVFVNRSKNLRRGDIYPREEVHLFSIGLKDEDNIG